MDPKQIMYDGFHVLATGMVNPPHTAPLRLISLKVCSAIGSALDDALYVIARMIPAYLLTDEEHYLHQRKTNPF